MVPSNAKDLVRPSPNSEEFIFLAHCGCEIHSLNVCLQDVRWSQKNRHMDYAPLSCRSNSSGLR